MEMLEYQIKRTKKKLKMQKKRVKYLNKIILKKNKNDKDFIHHLNILKDENIFLENYEIKLFEYKLKLFNKKYLEKK